MPFSSKVKRSNVTITCPPEGLGGHWLAANRDARGRTRTTAFEQGRYQGAREAHLVGSARVMRPSG